VSPWRGLRTPCNQPIERRVGSSLKEQRNNGGPSLDGRGTQCRSCPRTAGRIPIRTRAATELEPRDFDLSAHAGEHRSLIGCYSGHRRQSEKRRADRAACGALAIQPCLQPIRSSGSSGKGCIVGARAARDQWAHAVQCVRSDSNSRHPPGKSHIDNPFAGLESRNPHKRPICALEHPVALRLSDAPSISPQLTSHVREQIKGTAIGPRRTCEQLGQRH